MRSIGSVQPMFHLPRKSIIPNGEYVAGAKWYFTLCIITAQTEAFEASVSQISNMSWAFGNKNSDFTGFCLGGCANVRIV